MAGKRKAGGKGDSMNEMETLLKKFGFVFKDKREFDRFNREGELEGSK